jgi:lipoyl(octanoyl) transferase
MSETSESYDFQWLGRISYSDALVRQEQLLEQRRANEIGDTILLLEHEPIYTIGRSRDRSSLEKTSTLPHPVAETNRGGQATYHGPGQLVGYPILDLKNHGQDLHAYLRTLEQAIIDFAGAHGIGAERREGLTGVWIGPRKLASLGVGVRHWISMHGFALNVSADLTGFDAIVPCGIRDVEMTSIDRERQRNSNGLKITSLQIEHVAEEMQEYLTSELEKLRGTTSVHVA